jgi:hypothetical protein
MHWVDANVIHLVPNIIDIAKLDITSGGLVSQILVTQAYRYLASGQDVKRSSFQQVCALS